jgi:FkbM family methyltransferase
MIKIYGEGKGVDFKNFINNDKPIIVQIGAHDGVVGEEYGLEEYLDSLESFKLFLIEPIKKYFDKLPNKYKKYEDKAEVIYCNHVISEVNGKVSMIDQEGMSKIVNSGELLVDSITLDDFIEEHNITNIDLLLLDCEGYEFKILDMVNFDTLSINCIRYEFYHIENQVECDNYLLDNNYKIDFCKFDDIYNKIAYIS